MVIDGADEVDSHRRVIKGGGGALLREKILAYNADRVVLVVDASKLSENLCDRFAIPVEFVPGNYICDVAFDPPIDAAHLEIAINSIPGVVENGLFTMIDPVVLVGREDGSVEEYFPGL